MATHQTVTPSRHVDLADQLRETLELTELKIRHLEAIRDDAVRGLALLEGNAPEPGKSKQRQSKRGPGRPRQTPAAPLPSIPEDVSLDAIDKGILRFLREPRAAKDILLFVEKSHPGVLRPQGIYRRIYRLRDAGILVPQGDGIYSLATHNLN